MEQILIFLCTPIVYTTGTGTSLFLFMFNYFILNMKREYRGLGFKGILTLSIFPGINFVFLIYNCMVFGLRTSKYKVVKVKEYDTKNKRIPSMSRI